MIKRDTITVEENLRVVIEKTHSDIPQYDFEYTVKLESKILGNWELKQELFKFYDVTTLKLE